jgi:hypothetical protein
MYDKCAAIGENRSKLQETTEATETKALTSPQEVALRNKYASLRQSRAIAAFRIKFPID